MAMKPKISTEKPLNNDDNGDNDEMMKVMGFGTFGPKKPTKIVKTETHHKSTIKSNVTGDDNDDEINKTKQPQVMQTKTARKFDIEEMMGKFYEKLRTDGKEHDSSTVRTTNSSDDDDDNDDDDSDNNKCSSKPQISTNDDDDNDDDDDDEDDDFIGPPLPPGFNQEEDNSVKIKDNNDGDDDDDGQYDLNDDNRYSVLPISHEIELKHGGKSVTALALDPNGARLVSGGIDYEIKFWDFGGMDSTLKSFRTITPCHSHSIKHLEFSSNGEFILVVSGSCVAKLIDRDGYVKAETIKGDQYISDMKNTKGHIAMLNSGCWHPMERNIFATCSNDGTCRLWDSQVNLRQHRSLMRPRSQHGLRTQPNVCAFSSTMGDLIALGCDDGSVQMWDTRKSFVNTAHLIRDAHQHSTDMSSLMFGYNGMTMATRSTDNTMKLWDMRMVRQSRPFGRQRSEPLHEWTTGLTNRYAQTDCAFSPDDRYLITATSCDERDNGSNIECGQLHFYSTSTFDLLQKIDGRSSSSNIRSIWHPKLNQIVTSGSDGSIQMYYDLKYSIRGALLCSYRQKRKRKEVFTMAQPTIITPHALPLFKQERRKSHYVQMLKDRKDPIKSRRPELPITGSGSGGRIAAAGKTFASFIARNLGVRAKIDDNEDPRDALLRHAKDAEENPYWVTPAYQQNQPKTIFASADAAIDIDSNSNNDDDDRKTDDDEPMAKKRKHIPV
ncbi:WD repeat-containing protein 70 [Dermatophagoides farinae]|uniref:WD repeat-containing protein 70 n=2 Tax=Dermatophagoides farinae TaxID=6954 RepID=A0A922I6L6_DERFA|nr:WD repeat-containing protein 70 [Dermatophagoides farinae]